MSRRIVSYYYESSQQFISTKLETKIIKNEKTYFVNILTDEALGTDIAHKRIRVEASSTLAEKLFYWIWQRLKLHEQYNKLGVFEYAVRNIKAPPSSSA